MLIYILHILFYEMFLYDIFSYCGKKKEIEIYPLNKILSVWYIIVIM